MQEFLKRTWLEIDINALENNYRAIKSFIGSGTKIMCVVKADAYGHGAEFISLEYQRMGADWLGVSNLDEAVQIRRAGVNLPILILGYTPANMANVLHKYNISQTVISQQYAIELAEFACKDKLTINIHIKLDTGMNRLGITYQNSQDDDSAIDAIAQICTLKGLSVQGIFTHFSEADDPAKGQAYTRWQFSNFCEAITKLKERGIKFALKHCSNSGAILNHPQMNMDMVRAGIILYGLPPSSHSSGIIPLQAVMRWKSVISQIKQVRPGAAVSYGRQFYAKEPAKIATIPVGYADGYCRNLSGANMVVCGKKAPIVGRICMDQLMLDVSAVPEITNDSIVTILGNEGICAISLDDLAHLAGTINYELACIIGKRVPRLFVKDDKDIAWLNYIRPVTKA